MTYIPTKTRQKTATVHVDGKDKFPIGNAHQAKSALKLINHAKPPLDTTEKAAVRRKAASYGVKPKPGSAADLKRGKA